MSLEWKHAWLSLPLALACTDATGSVFPDPGDAAVEGDPNNWCDLCPSDAAAQDVLPCVGLACQQVWCPGNETSSVSGTVFDPSGALPLADAVVYVPNAPLAPFVDSIVCDGIGTPVSGNPVVATLTDATGRFVLPNVPVGSNIPLVIQSGKWRRRITIPTVAQCVDNPVAAANTRLARKQNEGSPDDTLPHIAVITGCDALECMLTRRIGVDPAEITGPLGTGRVHVYRGTDDKQGLPAGAGDALSLFGSIGALSKYDVVLLASDCGGPQPRGVGAEANLESYVSGGGRVLATHSQVNWFAANAQCGGTDASTTSCIGDTALSGSAKWLSSSSLGSPFSFFTTLPKGQEMSKWYAHVTSLPLFAAYATAPGQLPLVEPHADVGSVVPSSTTPWIIAGDPSGTYDAHLLSIAAPLGVPATKQCGQVVFSSEEAVGTMTSSASAWPASCSGTFSTADHTPNELALEFLLFESRMGAPQDGKKGLPLW